MPETDYTPPDLSLRGGAEHVRAYQQSNGAVGYLWNGVPTLLLTVPGRRTGRPVTSALIFARDGADYLVVASKAARPSILSGISTCGHIPRADLQVADRKFSAVARTATPEQKPRLWKVVTETWPNYDAIRHEPTGTSRSWCSHRDDDD